MSHESLTIPFLQNATHINVTPSQARETRHMSVHISTEHNEITINNPTQSAPPTLQTSKYIMISFCPLIFNKWNYNLAVFSKKVISSYKLCCVLKLLSGFITR